MVTKTDDSHFDAEALESAREALPPGAWTAVAWKELYGD